MECVLVSAALTQCMFRWVCLSLSVKLKNWVTTVSLNCCWCIVVYFMCLYSLNVVRIFSAQVETESKRMSWLVLKLKAFVLKMAGALPQHMLQTSGAGHCVSTEHFLALKGLNLFICITGLHKTNLHYTFARSGFQWITGHKDGSNNQVLLMLWLRALTLFFFFFHIYGTATRKRFRMPLIPVISTASGGIAPWPLQGALLFDPTREPLWPSGSPSTIFLENHFSEYDVWVINATDFTWMQDQGSTSDSAWMQGEVSAIDFIWMQGEVSARNCLNARLRKYIRLCLNARWWWLFPRLQGFLENVWPFIPCMRFLFCFEISSTSKKKKKKKVMEVLNTRL